MFSAASPLLQSFPEPCGHSVWAPAAPRSAGGEAHAACATSAGSGDLGRDDSSPGSSSSDCFERKTLAALAGAGVLALRAHVLLSDLHDDLATGGLQDKLVEEVVQLLQLSRRCSKPQTSEQRPPEQQPQQETAPEDLQQLPRVCQQHGLDLPPGVLLQLGEVPSTVMAIASRRCHQVADAAGIDFQHSSSLVHGWNRTQHPTLPGEAAVRSGRAALWHLVTSKAVEVTAPLSAWIDASTRRHKKLLLAGLTSEARAAGSSSGGSAKDAAGDGRFCASCKLCRAELQLQQQQQHASAGRSSSSSSSCAPSPVSTDDPFMWRRLIWGLMGRVKPAARRLYAAEKGMCPHSDAN
ncbi:hypothetical protein COO60DRAFT_427608 [Scenedesmus sp. NREL 46B-D3]|nr:hypothetical protein COO60DRAFT_427608 [Scenedesmus sp. NREL 46B-D3]